jgi:hypothetical protein
MRALARPPAAASTICARSQSRCAVLALWARFFKAVRSPALSTTSTARYCGMPPPGQSPACDLLPGPAEAHWPQLTRVKVTYRGAFGYVTGVLPDGENIPLCRLCYGGSAHSFGFAIYSAAHDRYQDAVLRTGLPAGTPQEALDTACMIHLAGLGHEPRS